MAKKDLKTFIRRDGTGRLIPGSSVLRLNKPKVGDWYESPKTYSCCNPGFTITYEPTLPITDITLTVDCGVTEIINLEATGVDADTVSGLVDALNENFGYLGSFSVDGTSVVFYMSQELANFCTDSLSFEVASA